jgi:tRNA/tmRNA/rRNA uracil-C5-methylase (TrmA/RlmC/RlmD family)
LVFSLQTEAPEWPKYQQQVRDFLASLPLASVYLLHNTGKADIVDGDFELIAGRPSLEEHILQFRFDIQPKSFFQTNTR